MYADAEFQGRFAETERGQRGRVLEALDTVQLLVAVDRGRWLGRVGRFHPLARPHDEGFTVRRILEVEDVLPVARDVGRPVVDLGILGQIGAALDLFDHHRFGQEVTVAVVGERDVDGEENRIDDNQDHQGEAGGDPPHGVQVFAQEDEIDQNGDERKDDRQLVDAVVEEIVDQIDRDCVDQRQRAETEEQ
ncbi:MAG: hypothetical protein R2838_17370 [Caldilineaceae bacterium]